MTRYPRSALYFAAIAFACASLGAIGQSYPSKPIKVIVPQQGGSGVDTVARIGVTTSCSAPSPRRHSSSR